MLQFGKIGGAVAMGVMLALSLLVPGAFARNLENASAHSSAHAITTTKETVQSRTAHPLHRMHQNVRNDDGQGDDDNGDGSDGGDGADGGDGF